MAPAIESGQSRHRFYLEECLSRFIHSATCRVLSPFPPFSNIPPPFRARGTSPPPNRFLLPSSNACMPFVFPVPSQQTLALMLPASFQRNSSSSRELGPQKLPQVPAVSVKSRISALSGKKVGGPAFVGHVFSMCDLSGTGLMAVSTHFDIPFISRRTPSWIKKIFANITKSERNGPVFHFFLDLNDAVAYVKRLNIPSGVVGACRLDLAYEYFKEKPHLFQLVPNDKQVKAAEKLLKRNPLCGVRRKTHRIHGVPVFSARNLDIAIATEDGIKWYTPYFFDKGMLDNILDESVDQHFRALIKSRHSRRWKDVGDDNLTAEMAAELAEAAESLWEPPEIEEMMSEIGSTALPLILGAFSKAAELQLGNAVDKLLLGNRWLRKAIGVQPEFPYVFDSFENRSSTPVLKSSPSSIWKSSESSSEQNVLPPSSSTCRGDQILGRGFEVGPFLPKVTMLGISKSESDGKTSFKKRMDELMKRLKQVNHGGSEIGEEERDPLFVANVGDFPSGFGKVSMGRWVRSADVEP